MLHMIQIGGLVSSLSVTSLASRSQTRSRRRVVSSLSRAIVGFSIPLQQLNSRIKLASKSRRLEFDASMIRGSCCNGMKNPTIARDKPETPRLCLEEVVVMHGRLSNRYLRLRLEENTTAKRCNKHVHHFHVKTFHSVRVNPASFEKFP
jgi:hypothetical protein